MNPIDAGFPDRLPATYESRNGAPSPPHPGGPHAVSALRSQRRRVLGEDSGERSGEGSVLQARWLGAGGDRPGGFFAYSGGLVARVDDVLPGAAWYARGRDRAILSPTAYERVKRFLDLFLCLLALPFVLALLALLAVAVRLDSPGPAFYTQLRTGRGGKRFRMFKLRTMVRNAEELKERYAHLNELTWPDFKITDDPRITRIGRFLRRTSLDELPQLLNVLRGEMSLVGPRPTSFEPDVYSLWHTARLDVPPGLTGLWQISGRSALEFDERLRLDIAYIRNRSLWLDAVILLRTVGAVWSGRGAA